MKGQEFTAAQALQTTQLFESMKGPASTSPQAAGSIQGAGDSLRSSFDYRLLGLLGFALLFLTVSLRAEQFGLYTYRVVLKYRDSRDFVDLSAVERNSPALTLVRPEHHYLFMCPFSGRHILREGIFTVIGHAHQEPAGELVDGRWRLAPHVQ